MFAGAKMNKKTDTDGQLIRDGYVRVGAAMSKALQAWNRVEEEVFEIFHTVAVPHDRKVAAAVFFAARHFDSKREITKAALQAALGSDALLGEWIKDSGNGGLNQRLRKRAIKRNAIAHGCAAYLSPPAKVSSTSIQVTPPSATAHISIEDFYNDVLTLEEIEQDTGSFFILISDLQAFRAKLQKRLSA